MKFSILIPVYNAEKYLEDALKSVISQKYGDFEIVMVDDGSTDESHKIYSKYINEYPDNIIAIKQENSGQLASRCKAVNRCSGDYCLFLDADDLLVKNTLSDLAVLIEKYKSPDIIIFPFYYDRDGKLEKSKLICEEDTLFEGDNLKTLYEQFLKGTLLNAVWTKAVRRDIALKSTENYEKYKNLRCSEDKYQSMVMSNYAKRVLYTPNPYYKYRILDGSITRRYLYDNIQKFNTKNLYEFEKNCLEEWGFDTENQKNTFDAKWMDYPLYVLDLFYYKVSKNERSKVLKYPWEDFLPREITLSDIKKSTMLTEQKKLMWDWIESKNYRKLTAYFRKKRTYKTIRNLKRKLLK